MEPFTLIVLVIILIFLFFRLRKTFQKVKNFDRSDEIQSQLQKLRKKRDEDNDIDGV